MGTTNFDRVAVIDGISVGAVGSEVEVINSVGVFTGNVSGTLLGTRQIAKINIVAADLKDNAETATGFAIPANAVVEDVIVRVNTKEDTATTKTISIGTDSTNSGDADGYKVSLSVAAAGIFTTDPTVTAGATETYVSAINAGALLGAGKVGTNTDGDFGIFHRKLDTVSAGKDVTVTFGDAGGANELDMDIFIKYFLLEA